MYRFQVLVRDLNKAVDSAQKDIERRQAKLKEDVAAIKKLDEGLTGWIDQNLERLNDGEGSEAK